jgi:meso-butanediol dehydrogenase/(S,S)-butanediol dehydrogenase/diacetyl reductase
MVDRTVERYGGLDVLVNNARWSMGGTAVEPALADWEHAMAAMVTASFVGAKYAVPHMEHAGGGSIIGISSGAGILAAARMAVYGTAKAAVIMLTKQLLSVSCRRTPAPTALPPVPAATAHRRQCIPSCAASGFSALNSARLAAR